MQYCFDSDSSNFIASSDVLLLPNNNKTHFNLVSINFKHRSLDNHSVNQTGWHSDH